LLWGWRRLYLCRGFRRRSDAAGLRRSGRFSRRFRRR